MATTTPNFGWSVPTSTDLVKDGATAIETLGDSIDASLVDLKGGTTGQVLSKNSNTDMDFTWVAQDDSNAIQNTIVDAKGDLIAASAADTPARLAVGTNGQLLTADSTASTGLAWTTVSSGGMTQIASTSLSGSATTVSSIPATYNTLLIVINALSTDANIQLEFYVNGTTSGYAYSGTTQIGSTSATYGNIGDSRIRLSAGQSAQATATSNAWALNFYNYASTTAVKTYDMSGFWGGSVDNGAIFQGGAWRNTSAITSCTVTNTGANFDGGTITVYGVK
jgi:hypothetical protein